MIIIWRITSVCDLACPFCAYSRAVRQPRRHADPHAVLHFGAVLRDWAQSAARPVLVSWLGGEPLLWPPLWEVSRRFKNEFGFRLSLTTSAAHLDSDEACAQLSEVFDEVTFSVDAFAAQHDEWRGRAGVWEAVRACVGRLHQRSPQTLRLRANVVLMRDNLADFPALCETLAAWGITDVTFNTLGGRDRPEFFPAHHLRPSDVLWLREHLPRWRAQFAQRGLTLHGTEAYVARLAEAAHGHPVSIADCGPGENFLFIDELGRVAPCSFTTEGYSIALADLQSPADVRALPAHFAHHQQHQRLPICDNCPSTQVFGKFQSPLQLTQLR